jgi:putative membrane protein
MVSKSIIFFLGLCPIIPLIAHFAEGLIFIAEFWLLFGVGVLSKMLITYFKIDKTAQVITYINLMLAAALYAQAVGTVFPVIAVSLERYIYITAFSYILIISIGMYDSTRYPLELPITYSLLLAVISILRELIVFGTVSLPTPSGLFSITLLPLKLPLKFWGSSAGVLMLLGISLWLSRSFHKGELLPFQTDESYRNRQ